MTDIAERSSLTLYQTLEEQRSAKEPYQRSVFDSMIKMIESGKADSILCYHVNRLARNMVEGGLLQHLLTKGTLKEIRTYNEVFRSGDNILPFILQTAMSTQYSLDLSVHVKRGLQSKVDKGDFPHRAPEGYLNNHAEGTIEADPERFPLIRRAWELMATGTYSVERLLGIINNQWGYRTRKTRKRGGQAMCKSSLHKILSNVFYTGHFLYKGELFRGNHPPMISFEEFEAVQRILKRNGHARAEKHEFPYTGLIQCARCGRQITAEHQSGQHHSGDYYYYRCSNIRRCHSKPVRQEAIEAEIERYLQSVAIAPNFRSLAIEVIERAYREESQHDQEDYEQQNRTLEDAQRQMNRLIQMSLRELLTEDEFMVEKKRLNAETNALKISRIEVERQLERAREGAIEVAEFVTSAPYQFSTGTIQQKREIARRLGVVYRLRDGILETELHPLLVPIYQLHEAAATRRIEPGKTAILSTKSGASAALVHSGGEEWTMFEPTDEPGRVVEYFLAVWELLLKGAPRIISQ